MKRFLTAAAMMLALTGRGQVAMMALEDLDNTNLVCVVNYGPYIVGLQAGTNRWDAAIRTNALQTARLVGLESGTNDWNTAFSWGDWSTRVSGLEGRSNAWNWAVSAALYAYSPTNPPPGTGVTSVNGTTGAVSVTAAGIGALTNETDTVALAAIENAPHVKTVTTYVTNSPLWYIVATTDLQGGDGIFRSAGDYVTDVSVYLNTGTYYESYVPVTVVNNGGAVTGVYGASFDTYPYAPRWSFTMYDHETLVEMTPVSDSGLASGTCFLQLKTTVTTNTVVDTTYVSPLFYTKTETDANITAHNADTNAHPDKVSVTNGTAINLTLIGTATLSGSNVTAQAYTLNGDTITEWPVGGGSVPYTDWTGTVTPADGTATVAIAHGNMPVLVTDAPCVLTLDPTGYGTAGVSRVSLSYYTGTNSFTFATNIIDYVATPTVDTNGWNSLLIRRVSDGAWKGVGL